MFLTDWILRKRVVAYVVTILLVAGGIWAYKGLGRLEFPDFTIKTAVVMATYPGATPEEVEKEVTDTLETAIQQLSQLKEIRSLSKAGLSIIYVDIKDNYFSKDMPQIWDELRKKVNDAKSSLPPGVDRVVVNDDFGDVYGIFYALTGDGFSYSEMKDFSDVIKRELLLVKDVASVELWGDQTDVIYLEISRSRIAAMGISLGDIINTLNQQHQIVDAGQLDTGDDYVRIRPTGGLVKPENISELLVRMTGPGNLIRIGDVADIKTGYLDPPRWEMRFNGQPAIGIGIATVEGGNVVVMGKAVKEKIEELMRTAPAGMDLHTIALQSDTVTTAIDDFLVNLVEAVIIVIAVLCVTMGISSGLLMGVILLLTIFGTFIMMHVMHVTLQLISLGALILALGMLVDNAIVVTEGILVRVQQGMGRRDAAAETVKQTAWPLLGATFVAILAFAAIGTSQNTTGEFLNHLFMVMAISLGLSWILAVTLTPFFCVRFMRKPKGGESSDPYHSPFFKFYRRFLDYCLHRRLSTLAVLIGLLAAAIAGFGFVEESFFPSSNRPQFMIDYWRPEGTRIQHTSADLKQIEDWLVKQEKIENVTTFTGQGALRFILTYDPEMPNSSYGQLLVTVNDFREIESLLPHIRDYLTVNFPDAEFKLKKFSRGPDRGAKVEVKFYGDDPSVLRSLSEKAQSIMAEDKLAVNIHDNWRQRVKILEPVIDEALARRTGISRPMIQEALAANFKGAVIGLFRKDNRLIPIIMRPPEKERQGAGDIRNTQIISPLTGQTMPLSRLITDVRTRWEDPVIHRKNRMREITAMCDPLAGNASALRERVKDKIEAIQIPEGYTFSWGGEYKESRDAQKALFRMIPIFFLAMVVTIIFMFNAIRQTIIIFLCLPLATIGVSAGLLLFNEPFGFMCLLGFLGLSGMLIKNAVVLIDQIDQEIKEGRPGYAAILDSSVSRLRPVVMAAMTTVLGMLPLLTDVFYAGMSVTIMSGLTFATVLTLIVVPVLYAMFFGIHPDGHKEILS
ncbi:MAG: efflux RND transporter permease subunit [Proteobacteria bacterium]|nr:efflux RND transporter permease subunit [Pseudomonadota bacterium]